MGYVDYLDEKHKIAGGCLAVGMIAMRFFYMDRDFYAGQFTKRAIPRSFTLSPRIAMYFISILNKNQRAFQGTLVRHFEDVFNNTKVKLPTKNGEINFSFMEDFMAELEAERIAELEAYFVASGLKDYTLTGEEQKVLADFENQEFLPFDVTGVFDVKNTCNILSRDVVEDSGDTPYLGASADNNSVISSISYDDKYLDRGNCVFIGGKTFVVSYQERDFFSNDSHNLVLYLKDTDKETKNHYLYLATCINKSLKHKYSWGDSVSNKKIQRDTVTLPVYGEGPDYENMETFISAIQKLVIRDVVLYANEKQSKSLKT